MEGFKNTRKQRTKFENSLLLPLQTLKSEHKNRFSYYMTKSLHTLNKM